jgi:mono/diheme cytochrome c family protein
MNIGNSNSKARGHRVSRSLGMAVAGGVLLCSLSPPLQSQEPSRGQALYENHCRACHESSAHTREGRKVKSMAALRDRVAGWSTHAGLDWTAQDVDDVTDYLNRAFYRFESTP